MKYQLLQKEKFRDLFNHREHKYYLTKKNKMKTTINLNFQMASNEERPDDASLNRENIVLDDLGNIPSVGDFVCFDNKNDVEVPYLVKTRLFEYRYNDKSDSWSINANVVVEKQNQELYNKLIKM